jgi:hypothetical protein
MLWRVTVKLWLETHTHHECGQIVGYLNVKPGGEKATAGRYTINGALGGNAAAETQAKVSVTLKMQDLIIRKRQRKNLNHLRTCLTTQIRRRHAEGIQNRPVHIAHKSYTNGRS